MAESVPVTTMDYLVLTLARINRYGEPSFGLRRAIMRIARFLIVDLANAPDEAKTRAGRVKEAAAHAQLRLMLALFKGWGTSPRHALFLDKDRPRVDDFDIVNAALDILLSVDEHGNREGVIPDWEAELKQYSSDPKALVEHARAAGLDMQLAARLAFVASDRRVFGGTAAPNSPDEAIACKAFTIAVQMADYRVKIGLLYRWGLKDLVLGNAPGNVLIFLGSPLGPRDVAWPRVNRSILAILILGGFADAEEAKRWVGWDESGWGGIGAIDHAILAHGLGDKVNLWESMGLESSLHRGLFDSILENHESLVRLRTIQDFVSGPARGAFAERVAAAFALIKKRTDDYVNNYQGLSNNTPAQNREQAENFVSGYRELLQKWADTKPDWDPVIAEPLCPPEGATPRIVIFANGVNGRIMIKKLYVGVPTTLGVIFPEPYGGDEYPVKVQSGGGELTLTARPIDEQRLLFETERFVINAQ